MLKIKLKLLQRLHKIKLNRKAEKVSLQVNTTSISWIIVSNLLKITILLFFGAVVLFPFFYMISTSLMTQDESTSKLKTILIPGTAQGNNYKLAFANGYWQAIMYSFGIAAITIILKIIVTIFLGYAFSMKKYKGKKLLWAFFLSLLMLPEVALLSGQYQMVVKLQWHYGSAVILGLFTPFIASVFSAVMFKNAFESIPDRMKEASMVDGTTSLNYFFKVALPIIQPTTLTVVILTAFASWNSYMWPALLLQGKDVQTIPTWIFKTGKNENGDMLVPIRMAGTVLAILPMFIVYFGFRNRIMNAISRQGSAIKG